MPIELSRGLQGLQLTTVEVRGPVLLGMSKRSEMTWRTRLICGDIPPAELTCFNIFLEICHQHGGRKKQTPWPQATFFTLPVWQFGFFMWKITSNSRPVFFLSIQNHLILYLQFWGRYLEIMYIIPHKKNLSPHWIVWKFWGSVDFSQALCWLPNQLSRY